MAHSPTCSTPTERGRTNSKESKPTACTSPATALNRGCAARTSYYGKIRCASRSTSFRTTQLHLSTDFEAEYRTALMRAHNTGQCSGVTPKSLPRLSRVRCRILAALR